jgi:hypothetical protein
MKNLLWPETAVVANCGHPLNEHTCNSCWNDPHQRFDHGDFHYCPRHKGTPRRFEVHAPDHGRPREAGDP